MKLLPDSLRLKRVYRVQINCDKFPRRNAPVDYSGSVASEELGIIVFLLRKLPHSPEGSMDGVGRGDGGGRALGLGRCERVDDVIGEFCRRVEGSGRQW